MENEERVDQNNKKDCWAELKVQLGREVVNLHRIDFCRFLTVSASVPEPRRGSGKADSRGFPGLDFYEMGAGEGTGTKESGILQKREVMGVDTAWKGKAAKQRPYRYFSLIHSLFLNQYFGAPTTWKELF